MLANLVQESANAPGAAIDIVLGGAPGGRRPFSVFGNGAQAYYFLTDGAQAEWGIGTVTVGSPNKLARTTVIGNTANTVARLSFAGAVIVYNDLPAERLPLLGSDGKWAQSTIPLMVNIQSLGWSGNFQLGTADTAFVVCGVPSIARLLELECSVRLESNSTTACSAIMRAEVRNAADTVTEASIDLGLVTLHSINAHYVTYRGWGDHTFAGDPVGKLVRFFARIDQAVSPISIYDYRIKLRAFQAA